MLETSQTVHIDLFYFIELMHNPMLNVSNGFDLYKREYVYWNPVNQIAIN